MKRKYIWIASLSVLLGLSIAANVYFLLNQNISYLQGTNQVYNMETGILHNLNKYKPGKDYTFQYDLTNKDYAALLKKYEVEKIAGNGSEKDKAINIMNEFSGRLTHESNFTANVEINALDLLEYSLDNKSHGINCRCKAQILNELCLSLGIYSRKVWIKPFSKYDDDCHVVNEIWDSTLKKWIMLDITNNEYWIDENGTPLSILEIRSKCEKQEFCTPITPDDNTSEPREALNKYYDDYLYIIKNLAYIEYTPNNTTKECDYCYLLISDNMSTDYQYIISENSVAAPPTN